MRNHVSIFVNVLIKMYVHIIFLFFFPCKKDGGLIILCRIVKLLLERGSFLLKRQNLSSTKTT